MPTAPAICFRTPCSVRSHRCVRSYARSWKARSFGMNAVSGTVPSASTATGLPGFAASTAAIAWSTMSKSYQLRSNVSPSAARTAARLLVPDGGVEAAAGAATAVPTKAVTHAPTNVFLRACRSFIVVDSFKDHRAHGLSRPWDARTAPIPLFGDRRACGCSSDARVFPRSGERDGDDRAKPAAVPGRRDASARMEAADRVPDTGAVTGGTDGQDSGRRGSRTR